MTFCQGCIQVCTGNGGWGLTKYRSITESEWPVRFGSWLLVHTFSCICLTLTSAYTRPASFLCTSASLWASRESGLLSSHQLGSVDPGELTQVHLPGHHSWHVLGSRAMLFPKPSSGKVAPGSALSQVSRLFQIPGLWPKNAGRRVSREQSKLYCSHLPRATHLLKSRLSNWEN